MPVILGGFSDALGSNQFLSSQSRVFMYILWLKCMANGSWLDTFHELYLTQFEFPYDTLLFPEETLESSCTFLALTPVC